MARGRTHSIEFKRQVAQAFLAGETLHGLAKRHDVCRNLIREAGEFDDAESAGLIQAYEAASRPVGKQGPLRTVRPLQDYAFTDADLP